MISSLPFCLKDSDDETRTSPDAASVAFLPVEQYDLPEIIAASPLLRSSSTWTLLGTLLHLFYCFSSLLSISKEAFSKHLFGTQLFLRGFVFQQPIEVLTRSSNTTLFPKWNFILV
ncbi:hypothetical protein ACROYT_G015221 [Oculina patagonica]